MIEILMAIALAFSAAVPGLGWSDDGLDPDTGLRAQATCHVDGFLDPDDLPPPTRGEHRPCSR